MEENSIGTKNNSELKSSGGSSEEFDRKRFKKCLSELQELLSKTNMTETIKNDDAKEENDEEKTSNNASSFSSFSFDDFKSSSSSSIVSLTANNDL